MSPILRSVGGRENVAEASAGGAMRPIPAKGAGASFVAPIGGSLPRRSLRT